MEVHVNHNACEGHGRCYSLEPELFEPDEIGHGIELNDGVVKPGMENGARIASQNCPEHAVELAEDSP